jgi:hypothetical protein
MRRRRTRRAVIAVLLLVVVIAIAAGGSKSSSSLPKGQWGKVISCLEGHPLFAVYDGNSSNAGAPTASTTKLDVWQNVKGIDLANVTEFSTPAQAQAAARSAVAGEIQVGDPSSNVGAIGPVEYLFVLGGNGDPPQPLADTQNQLAITDCVQQAYPGNRVAVQLARGSCPDGTIGTGSNTAPATHETVTGVNCTTIAQILKAAWVWRWGELMWGGVPGETPGNTSPQGWTCKETHEYFSTADRTQWDDGSLVGSTTRCSSGSESFAATMGQVTPWGYAGPES